VAHGVARGVALGVRRGVGVSLVGVSMPGVPRIVGVFRRGVAAGVVSRGVAAGVFVQDMKGVMLSSIGQLHSSAITSLSLCSLSTK
jgi:hypothetical protein